MGKQYEKDLRFVYEDYESTYDAIYIREVWKGYNLYLHSTVFLKQIKCNTINYSLKLFWYKDAKIWSDLPNEINNYFILVEFKNQIKNGKDQHVFAICVQDCYKM